MLVTADDIAKLGTILGVWAHPDDESWCMGGIMACAAANGQRVVCITATFGDAGKTADEAKWPQAQLGQIRKQELELAMDVLGVKEHVWLEYRDGKLPEVDPAEATHKIADVISKVQPDTIFSFGPDGLTGHDDHRSVYAWTLEAIKKTGSHANFYRVIESKEDYESIGKKCDEVFNVYFNIGEPITMPNKQMDLLFEVPEAAAKKKIESLRVQECQTAGMFADPLGLEFVAKTTGHEGFMKVTE